MQVEDFMELNTIISPYSEPPPAAPKLQVCVDMMATHTCTPTHQTKRENPKKKTHQN